MTPISKEELELEISDKLGSHFGMTTANADAESVFCACAMLIREMISREKVIAQTDSEREVHYLSMEFLMGRSLEKNAFNLGILDQLTDALNEIAFNQNSLCR